MKDVRAKINAGLKVSACSSQTSQKRKRFESAEVNRPRKQGIDERSLKYDDSLSNHKGIGNGLIK